MNQQHLISINNQSIVTKSTVKQQDLNSQPVAEGEEQQDFSSELDKQIENQETPRSDHAPQLKQPQQQNVPSKEQQQKVAELVIESGNNLPLEQFVEQNSVQVDTIEDTHLTELEDTHLTELEKTQLTELEKTQLTEIEKIQLTEFEKIQVTEHEKTQLTEHEKTQVVEVENTQLPEHDNTQVSTQQTTASEQLVLEIDAELVIDESELTDTVIPSSTGTEQRHSADGASHKAEVDPIGLIKTQELHAAVNQVKEIVVNAKTSEHGDTKVQLGKIVAQAAQKISVAQQGGGNTESSDNKQQHNEQGQSAAKIRPDILQALSAKRAVETNTSTATKTNNPVLPLGSPPSGSPIVVQEHYKTVNNNLKLPEVALQVKQSLPLPSAGQAVDRAATGGFGSTFASLIHGQATNHTDRVVQAESPILNIQPALQSKAWSRVLSSRVVWMAREGIQQVTLKLNPAHLGPVDIKVTMHNDQANVTFIAQHSTTRDALEQALPRLRESFTENGLELADAEVSQQSSEQAGDDQAESDNIQGDAKQSALAGNSSENDQQLQEDEQDLESGVSIYA